MLKPAAIGRSRMALRLAQMDMRSPEGQRLQDLIQKIEVCSIDHIISQPHWQPTLNPLALAIARTIQWSKPCA